MPWRITFVGAGSVKSEAVDKKSRTVKLDYTIKSADRIELRDDDGQIVRLGKGADFELIETPLGLKPVYGSGPVYVGKKGGCGKYRTSCWVNYADPVSKRPDIFMRPGEEKNTDEFFALMGNILIYEFDENDKPFTICTIEEGKKAIIKYDKTQKTAKKRYTCKTTSIKDAEYRFILEEFINPLKWR